MTVHICHLTVLNPALHSRIYYKLALSQVKLGYRVTVVGQDTAKNPYVRDGVEIYPIRPFGRLSLRRLFFSLYMSFRAWKIDADIYTIHTPELLGTALLLTLRGKKLIYDVHEDYRKNVEYGDSYGDRWRSVLAALIRRTERFMSKRLDAISYAEDSYDNILDAPRERVYFLRNKFSTSAIKGKVNVTLPETPYMLYTGTLSGDWGLWKTISLWKTFNTFSPLHLIVAGHTQLSDIVYTLKKEVEDSGLSARFTLIGGEEYVAYADIVYLIRHCLFGTALYKLTPQINGKVPTKFYEYMALGRPLLYTSDPTWNLINRQTPIGVPYTGDKAPEEILAKLSSWHAQLQPSDYSWDLEEPTLALMLQNVLPLRT